MTVAELKKALSKYPDDMKVEVDLGTDISSIEGIRPFIMNKNIKSIVICSDFYWFFGEKE